MQTSLVKGGYISQYDVNEPREGLLQVQIQVDRDPSLSVIIGRGGARGVDHRPDAYGARVAYDGLPGCCWSIWYES